MLIGLLDVYSYAGDKINDYERLKLELLKVLPSSERPVLSSKNITEGEEEYIFTLWCLIKKRGNDDRKTIT